MKTVVKIGIVVLLAGAVAGLIAIKASRSKVTSPAEGVEAAKAVAEAPVGPPGTKMDVPRLVDVGAGKCIPCKLMAPILDELREEFKGRLQVDFVDVWVNPEAGKPFNVEMIPTQIFYAADGKELFRHTGFYGREEILAKWKELGIDLHGRVSASQ